MSQTPQLQTPELQTPQLNTTELHPGWKGYEKLIFRIAFIYFLIQALPLDWKYFRGLFAVRWSELPFQDLFRLTTYMPRFLPAGSIPSWGLASFANWGIALLLALAGAWVWSLLDRKTREYDRLYYLLRVLLRYRLAIGMIGYGVIKLFPLEMPYPSLSELHEHYGDLLPWKAYAFTTGVAKAHYETTLGLLEIGAGFLMLYRKTATIGAGIITAILINVVTVNFAYQLGEHVYSAYLLSIALFLLAYDTPRLFHLLVNRRLALANRYQPDIWDQRFKRSRFALRASFLLFILLYGYRTYAGFYYDGYPYPRTTGLSDAYGYYNVKEFRLNNRLLPYSLTDSLRWQDVVFEKWNTISIRSPREVKPDLSNPEITVKADQDKDYESAGSGGRHFYSYKVDSSHHTLVLLDKNKNYRWGGMTLQFSRPDSSTIFLSGIDERNDSISVVLEKIHKKYLLTEGRRKPIKIY